MRRTLLRLLATAALALATAGVGTVTVVAPAQAAYGAVKWPATGTITSKVDDRCPGYDNHDGYDIAGNYRSVVSAAYSGTVSYIGWDPGGYGNYVIISHVNGWSSLYAHLDGYVSRMRVGEYFARNDGIGYMGYTGGVSPPGIGGTHLHFEMLRYNTPQVWNSAGSCYQNVTRTNSIPFDFAGLN
ncbi:murein hydrolase activator EnvC family protein [Micromonospora echinofusca]|uniref:Peptidoglycan DD-metalloendopeptidase family protein n=1 Tax=Micromonospora echinofusca TaxID=47858 RepID=A0ABS3VKG2_MICEH|nr:M23 family metallopeptidase [Micromonospora echinofusca]MBO4204973.1 peptidoglycan DD-metalloendopeptidase family protein [Micromonospora echinofusca]